MSRPMSLSISAEEDLVRVDEILHDAWFDPDEDLDYDSDASTFSLRLWRETAAWKGDPEDDRYARCTLRISGVKAANIEVREHMWCTFTRLEYRPDLSLLSLETMGTVVIQLRVEGLSGTLADTGEVVEKLRDVHRFDRNRHN